MTKLFSMIRGVLAFARRLRYGGARDYWEKRYAAGGNSGSGSYGRLAVYKAGVVNDFVRQHRIRTVTEFGCGDGQQLLLTDFPAYTGLDISESAVARCRALFEKDSSKRFEVYDPESFESIDFQSDMTLSLEVVFHLTEDDLYNRYMQHLFASARHWVVIFSSDEADTTGGIFPHFRPRRFSGDVPAGWILRERRVNPHRDISVSDFFFFERLPG
ncbi:MAG: class I SAM-dependent methyltransferase [Saprospiraceae bacterium]|nr:class I SAM-dependent methyltransferase [Saprospiraceae bacterium]